MLENILTKTNQFKVDRQHKHLLYRQSKNNLFAWSMKQGGLLVFILIVQKVV